MNLSTVDERLIDKLGVVVNLHRLRGRAVLTPGEFKVRGLFTPLPFWPLHKKGKAIEQERESRGVDPLNYYQLWR